MLTRAWLGSVALLGLAACGGGASPEEGEQQRSAIQGGTIEPGHPYAVAVVSAAKRIDCSGTLIAPNLVLTARHCVAPMTVAVNAPIDCAKDTFGKASAKGIFVSTCPVAKACDTMHAAADVIVPEDAAVCANDIALIILKDSVPDSEARPAAPLLTPLADTLAKLGKAPSFTAIAFGRTSNGVDDSGTRRAREGMEIVCVPGVAGADASCKRVLQESGSLQDNQLYARRGICPGDSGSGAFLARSLSAGQPITIGVAAAAKLDGTDCLWPAYSRTDAWGELLVAGARKAAERGGYPAPAWVDTLPTIESDAGTDANVAPPPGTSGDATASVDPPPPGTDPTSRPGCGVAPSPARGGGAGLAALGLGLGLAVTRRRRAQAT